MLARQFLHFCVAGTLGFLVDAGVVQALVGFAGADPFIARIASVALAVLTTFSYNRQVTFRGQRSARWGRELGRYLLGNAAGLSVNYAAYAASLLAWSELRDWPAAAVAIGSLAGMLVNFAAARWFVFRGAPDGPGKNR